MLSFFLTNTTNFCKIQCMYQPRFIQYLSLPPLPDNLISEISLDPADYTLRAHGPGNLETYIWTDDHNKKLDAWCKQNICPDMYFAFQILHTSNNIHKDNGTTVKLNYVMSTGGSNVLTEFYDDDKTTLLDSYHIEPHRWHILKVNTYHRVINLEPGQFRFAVTSRIFS